MQPFASGASCWPPDNTHKVLGPRHWQLALSAHPGHPWDKGQGLQQLLECTRHALWHNFLHQHHYPLPALLLCTGAACGLSQQDPATGAHEPLVNTQHKHAFVGRHAATSCLVWLPGMRPKGTETPPRDRDTGSAGPGGCAAWWRQQCQAHIPGRS